MTHVMGQAPEAMDRRRIGEANVLDRNATLVEMTTKINRVKYLGSTHPRSNNMKQYISQEFSIKLIDPSSFVILRDTIPPRDPDEEDEDEDDDEEDDTADEPPVVREPDDD